VRATWWAAAVVAAGCGGGDADGDARVRGAALRHLFRERERAGQLVVWADAREPGPVFSALGWRPDLSVGRADADLATTPELPVVGVTAADMARLFRDHPDGWTAFYRRYAGAPGLVEVGLVERSRAGASVVVGRACGEHCLHAWRVSLSSGTGGTWRVTRVVPLRVPRA
jgi:hypothetical protein